MFNSIISNGTLTIESVSICLLVSIILGMFISFIHMKTSKYSKNFVITLAILPMLVSVVMMMVNGNLGTSVAILGAFSLIRFRSLPGNSREIASVFWAMSIGLSIGMGQVYFATLITIIIGILLIIFYKTRFGEDGTHTKTLNIVIPDELDFTNLFNDIFQKYLTNYELVKVETTNLGSLFNLKYDINFKENISELDFINELRTRNGNLKINIHEPSGMEML
jgi:hypothetical protein